MKTEVTLDYKLIDLCVITCVLCDLSLGDHLFALWIHQLAVLILFQALQDGPGIGLGAETLQEG